MKVYTIEIAEAIEKEFSAFLKDWGGGYQMRFTRFIDLGGKQVDLYIYPQDPSAPPWMIIRVKSVFKSDQGECMQYFVSIPSLNKTMDDVLVSPEIWKLPALTDRILQSVKADLLAKINEGGGALEGGDPNSLPESSTDLPGGSPAQEEDEEDELEGVDLSGIVASDDDDSGTDINPEDILKAVAEESEESDQEKPEEPKEEEAEPKEEDSDFNPEDVIKE